LISALGEGGEAHWSALQDPARCVRPSNEEKLRGPFPIHPIGALDLDRFNPEER